MSLHSNIFGWDYVWRDFAASKGGEVLTHGHKPDGEIEGIVVPGIGESSVTITPVSAGTAAVIDFAPQVDFMFSIYRERPLHQLSKVFGMQDIVVGDKAFDHQFIIQSNKQDLLKQLLSDPKLRDLILAEETADLRIVPEQAGMDPRWAVRPGHNVVIYTRPVLIDHFDHLEGVYDILCKTVQHLEEMGLGTSSSQVVAAPQGATKLHSPLLDVR